MSVLNPITDIVHRGVPTSEGLPQGDKVSTAQFENIHTVQRLGGKKERIKAPSQFRRASVKQRTPKNSRRIKAMAPAGRISLISLRAAN
jgi:hypothetical protein